MADILGPCRLCSGPVLVDEPRHALYECEDPPRYTHWACWEARDNEWKNSIKRFDELSGNLQDSLKKLRRALK